jgi:2-polyprenyl-3-methyl-5-hydroxy-6-metoxy-1,4-benzoquinol methylase
MNAVSADRSEKARSEKLSLEQSQQQVPDIRAVMERIRAQIKSDISNPKVGTRAFIPTKPLDENGSRRAGELLHSEELRFLNANYQYARLNSDTIKSHRPGFIGKAIVKVKRKFLQLIWDGLLKEYFTNERDYQAHLVRFLNDIAKYTDARDAQNFWELVRKIDVDTTKALERIERIADEQSGDIRRVERELIENVDSLRRDLSGQLTAIQGAFAQQRAQIETVESVASGAEKIIAKLAVANVAHLPAAAEASSLSENRAGYSYLLLENRFRGSEEEISRRVEPYAEVFSGVNKSVLEIGGGRGELQRIFKARGIDSYMVDVDAAMVEAASASGVRAQLGDGIAHLRSLEDHSIAGVIALQVVEHLTRAQLEELMDLSRRKVVAGGHVIFETINPQSVLALSSNYFRDPTHIFPMHPDTLKYMMELAGFASAEVRYLSPVAAEAQLREVPISEYMSPQWAYSVELLNHNVKQLNSLLYGYQEFCIIGRVG